METTMTVFNEVQRQTQKWIYFLILIILLVFLFGIVQQLIFGKPFGNQPAKNWVLVIIGLIPLGLLIFVRLNILHTEISERGISYQYKPYHGSERTIAWDEIDKCYVRVYSPMKEFGGWGLRISLKDGGRALNVAGRYGIQLEMKSGEKLLLGTQKPEEASHVLDNLNVASDGTR